jgi:hypothetical protein
LKDSDITWLYGPFLPPSSTCNLLSGPITPQTHTEDLPTPSPTKSLLKKRDAAKSIRERSEYTFSLLREATGFRLPSPIPEPQAKFLSFDIDSRGLKVKEKKGKRVVFNEIVTLYREVVDEPEELDEDGEYFGDFDDNFDGID